MKLTLRRYTWLLAMQLALLTADLFFNAFGSWLSRDKLEMAIFFFVWVKNFINFVRAIMFKRRLNFYFSIQDACIILEYLLFTMALRATCVYQVGATHIILRNCKLFLFSITVYFLLSVSQHSWVVYQYRLSAKEITQSWPIALYALTVFQRLSKFTFWNLNIALIVKYFTL